MKPVRLLAAALSFAVPLVLAAPEAGAARRTVHHAQAHRGHRTTQAITATYHFARPHAARRLRADRANAGRMAQAHDSELMTGS